MRSKKEHLREWTKGYFGPVMFAFWLFAIRILAPFMVFAIFVYEIVGFVQIEVRYLGFVVLLLFGDTQSL